MHAPALACSCSDGARPAVLVADQDGGRVAAGREPVRDGGGFELPGLAHRLGDAVGSGRAGIIANASGFSAGLNRDAAAGVAHFLFLAFIPLALLGVIAALWIARGPTGALAAKA